MLQNRVDHLEILIGLMRQRIQETEKQNTRELRLNAAAAAETKRLTREIERWENARKDARTCRPITPEEDGNDNPGGTCDPSASKPTAGLNKSNENAGEGDDSLDGDDSNYEIIIQKPKARKATFVSANKSNKKPKKAAAKSGRTYSFDKNDYHPYNCPAAGCTKKVWFAKKDKPRLNSEGQVCDQEPWRKEAFFNKIYHMRAHMAKQHPAVPKVNYPPGFAPQDIGQSGKEQKPASKKAAAFPLAYGSDTSEEEFF